MKKISRPPIVIPLRPTHGTAGFVHVASVLPKRKRDKELFWVSHLVRRLPEFRNCATMLESCDDDSDGGHDVLVRVGAGNALGVQVTELTFELGRERESHRQRFLNNVLREIQRRQLGARSPLLVTCHVEAKESRRYQMPSSVDIVGAIENHIAACGQVSVVNIGGTRLHLEWIQDGKLFVPAVNNIGVDVDIDRLPQCAETYRAAVECIARNKKISRSEWLVIWTLSPMYFRDETLSYLREYLVPTKFARITFAESIDGVGFFRRNLRIHAIKN